MTNLTQFECDIFLSHNRMDQDWTARLAERLEQENWQGRKLKVFFSPWDIRPGQSIPLEIERALPQSRKVGLIMSPEAIASAWVELERLVTTYISVSAREARLIPLLRRACDIPPLVQHLLYINFTKDDQFEESYKTLLCVIKDEPLPRASRKTSNRPISLPASIPRPPAVGFVARRDAKGRDIVELLRAELAPERNQLVVLWGAGGVGKTTLAVEAAGALGGIFGQRIVWSSPELRADLTLSTLLDEIAKQLGRADLGKLAFEAKEEAVRDLLAEAHALVILDNFETINSDEQARCAKWLAQRASCPALITTRQRVAGAHNISINAMSPEEAREFVERWIKREAHNSHAFEGLERDRVIETAGRNPLCLGWVLARIDLAGEPGEVLAELTEGEGDAAQRIFDGSFNLPQLGDDGRDALLALSLFVPDASRDALAEAAGFGTDGRKRLNEAVMRLSSLWLLETTAGNKRLKIEGLTRELAKNRLSKDARAAEFRRRFVAYFRSYAEAHAQPSPEDYDALEAEKDNLLNAMDVAFASADWKSVLAMANVLVEPVSGMLSVRGYWDEAIQCGEWAIAVAQSINDKWAIAQFAGNTASIRSNRGEYNVAHQAHQQTLEAFKELGSEENIAVAYHQLAMLAQAQGEIEEARRLYDESLEIAKRLGNQSGIASTLHQLATLAQNQGDVDEARRLYNESLEIKKRLGDQHGIANTLHQLAMLAQARGDVEEARRLYEESLEIKKRLGNQSGIAITLHQMAMLAQNQEEIEEARRLYEESLEIEKRLGNQSGIAISLGQLGLLAEEEGNKAEAARLLREALSIFEKLGSPYVEAARRDLKRVEDESSEGESSGA